MIDPYAVLHAFLASRPALTTVCATTGEPGGYNIWAGTDPEPGYLPATSGSGLLFNLRPPSPEDYTGTIFEAGVAFRGYGVDDEAAIEVLRTLYDVLHKKRSATIHWALQSGLPQLLPKDETKWSVALVFWTVWLRNP